jgi:hypothetical protein
MANIQLSDGKFTQIFNFLRDKKTTYPLLSHSSFQEEVDISSFEKNIEFHGMKKLNAKIPTPEKISTFIHSIIPKFCKVPKFANDAKGKSIFRISTYESNNLLISYVMTHSDNALIKCGAPRHWIVIYDSITSQFIVFSGDGKSTNDDRQEQLSIPNDVKKIQISLKVSGSLGSIAGFKFEQTLHILFSAKNSTCNEYSDELMRAFFARYNVHSNVYRNVDRLEADLYAFEGKLVCGELITSNPKLGLHGDVYQNAIPYFVVWGIYTTDQPHIRCYLKDIEYIHTFANKVGLHVLSFYETTNYDANTICAEILSKSRDMLLLSDFEEIISYLINDGHIIENKGTFDHSCISGILEGLILRFQFKNGSEICIKFKYPVYTIHTMLMRTFFMKIKKNPSTFNSFPQMCSDYVDKWVVSDEGRKIWTNFILALWNEMKKPENYNYIIQKINEDDFNYISLFQDMIKKIQINLTVINEIDPMDDLDAHNDHHDKNNNTILYVPDCAIFPENTYDILVVKKMNDALKFKKKGYKIYVCVNGLNNKRYRDKLLRHFTPWTQ